MVQHIKSLIFGFVILTLASCASVDVSGLSLSTAKISNIETDEIFTPRLKRHQFDVAFDYAIEDFHPQHGLYSCSIQFALTKPDYSVSFGSLYDMHCPLDAEFGRIQHKVSGPLDQASGVVPRKYLEQMAFPVRYKVVILQKLNQREHKIIGESELFTSKVDKQMLLGSAE